MISHATFLIFRYQRRTVCPRSLDPFPTFKLVIILVESGLLGPTVYISTVQCIVSNKYTVFSIYLSWKQINEDHVTETYAISFRHVYEYTTVCLDQFYTVITIQNDIKWVKTTLYWFNN